jgi:hypothetical protein
VVARANKFLFERERRYVDEDFEVRTDHGEYLNCNWVVLFWVEPFALKFQMQGWGKVSGSLRRIYPYR